MLIDDAAGRRVATALKLKVTGTLGVLRLAAEKQLIDVAATVAQIRVSGLYFDEALIRATFSEWL